MCNFFTFIFLIFYLLINSANGLYLVFLCEILRIITLCVLSKKRILSGIESIGCIYTLSALCCILYFTLSTNSPVRAIVSNSIEIKYKFSISDLYPFLFFYFCSMQCAIFFIQHKIYNYTGCVGKFILSDITL